MASLAQRHTPGYPLHVTTRQDVELHGIQPGDVPAIQRVVCDVGLACAGACGDTVRNITVCPENGLRRGTWDVSGLVESIQTLAQSLSWIADLPRKFKISVSACPELCARPWINDVGLAANADGTFCAMIAGSLGAKPGTGLLLYETLDVGEVLPLVIAVLRLFHAEGDRSHRYQARLRHVRERLGDAAFRARVEALFLHEKATSIYSLPDVHRVQHDTPLRARLPLPLGDIAPEHALELGRALEAVGAELRLGLKHDLFVFGLASPELSPSLRALSDGTSVVSCPGTAWCTRGIADCRAAAERIRRRLPRDTRLWIAVGGCPNNCSEAAVAPVGLLGRVKRSGDNRIEGYRILAGGGSGCTPALGRELHPFVPAADVDQAVAWLVQEYCRAAEDNKTTFDDFLASEYCRLSEELARRYRISEQP